MSSKNTNNTSELNSDNSSSNKNLKTLKTLSLSSTDSLCSSNDLSYDINNPQKYSEETSTKSNKIQSEFLLDDSNKALAGKEINFDNDEGFDFSKTGAKPKNKKLPTTKSSLSSSTSSSLSSLISQCSNPNTNISLSSSTSSKKQSPSSFGSSKKNKKSDLPKSSSNKSSNWSCLDNEDDDHENLSLKNQNDFTEITTCPLCFKIVKGQLETHFMAEHREFECPFCGLLFDNDFVLNQHVNTVHNDDNTSFIPKKDDFKDLVTSGTSKAISIDDLQTIDNQEKNRLICPVCNLVINEGLGFLEIHVDSHFNNETVNGAAAVPPNDLMHFVQNSYSKQRSRTESVSSLTANVDENFEIDQVMTFTDGYAESNNNEDSNKFDFDYNSLRNDRMSFTMDEAQDEKDMEKNDYELALKLDREEKERFTKINENSSNPQSSKTAFSNNNQLNANNIDYLSAQLLDRQQNESLKYQSSKENLFDEDYAIELSADYQSDSEYATELETEWLKQKYGMTNVKASTKAMANLDRALKNNNIDLVTYHYEKDQIEDRINAVVDDSFTCSRGLIEIMQSIQLNKNITNRYLCTYCDHYSSGYIDRGYGCGYRNTQMLLSSIREDPAIQHVLFNNNNRQMPSITKIQQLIENAWAKGFDLIGRDQLNGVLKNTAKWIGASDICAMFSSLRIRTELIDIQSQAINKGSVASVLFQFVKEYFENASNSGQPIHPIYLQHDGHSRTIVGIETGKFNNLLLFDPGSRRNQIEQFRQNKAKSMHLFRRSLNAFKKREYQLLIIKSVIESDEEYERSKVLKSRKLT